MKSAPAHRLWRAPRARETNKELIHNYFDSEAMGQPPAAFRRSGERDWPRAALSIMTCSKGLGPVVKKARDPIPENRPDSIFEAGIDLTSEVPVPL